ncbi:alpha-amylase [Methanothrix sp.]|uniref:alpha-amylase n=1 Tax=Methanothrix sp. TaxID=90426 RepID=UPI003BB7F36B
MTLVSLSFEVHQPVRLKKNFFWDGCMNRQVVPDLWKYYFDGPENQRIFERVSDKCYLPANRAILEGIKKLQGSSRPFKVSYSFSGVFLEECQRYRPDVLDSFVDLIQTGMVEVLEQTYYHSLASLYDDPLEYIEQIKMHRELIWDIFALRPTTFENTELIYSDQIAQIADRMGYKAIFTEGVVADPNYVYRPPNTSIALLLRNYQLTDDIGFRFSSHNWEEYPLTADKYASWLARTPGKCINIFCDYETFGEHQWIDTGIFDFIRSLPDQVLRYENLQFATPCEVAGTIPPERELSIESFVSWADLERNTSCWLGNALQHACFIQQKRLQAPARESRDPDLLAIWRTLGLSDHLYYIFTHGGGPAEVHNYFSPYGSPYDAAVTYFAVLSDFHCRLKRKTHLADSPFRFATGIDQFTGDSAWTLMGLEAILDKIPLPSLEYHNANGDYALWTEKSLGDSALAEKLAGMQKLKGERLRKGLLRAVADSLATEVI